MRKDGGSIVLGLVTDDPFGKILGSDYKRFSSPYGIDGLAKESDDRLDILAVIAVVEGQGNFRQFIKAAKDHYQAIYIWEIWNAELDVTLQRYGFEKAEELVDGEVVKGWGWSVPLSDQNKKLKTALNYNHKNNA